MRMEAGTTEYGDGPERDALEGLLAQIAAGDREALGELYRRARGPVYALALGMLKNAQDAQDVTQDAFVRVWEAAGGYRAQGSPMAWVLTIARNLARMRLRQGGRLTRLSEEEWAAIPARARRSRPRTGISSRPPWPPWGTRSGRWSFSTPRA